MPWKKEEEKAGKEHQECRQVISLSPGWTRAIRRGNSQCPRPGGRSPFEEEKGLHLEGS